MALACKDISDDVFLGLVARVQARKGGRWCLVQDIEEITEWPWRLIVAKARKLIRRGLLDGCYCGCRGDFEIIKKV